MRLTDHLEQSGMTQRQLAEKIGVSERAVRRYCAGHRVPQKDILQKIYQVTGGVVTANDFVDLPETVEAAE